MNKIITDNTSDFAIENLCNAVIKCAADDWKTAKKCIDRNKKLPSPLRVLYGTPERVIESVESFLKSDYAKIFLPNGLPGEYIISELYRCWNSQNNKKRRKR